MSQKKFYVVGDMRGTVKEFAERAPGVSVTTMRERLNKFAAGEYPEERLFDVVQDQGGNAAWKAFSDMPRTENLQRIQPPTRFDEIYGVKQ